MRVSCIALGLAVIVLGLVTSPSSMAQEKPGKLTIVQEDTVKDGAREQYEAGRKQLAAWHASIKDPNELVVFETLTGENKGTYDVVRRGLHWADLDKEIVPEAERHAEVRKAIGDSRAKVVTKFYEELPELDTTANLQGPAKYYEIETFHVPLGKGDRFAAAVGRLRDAIKKTKSSIDIGWLFLGEGGEFGTWVSVTGHNSWADFDGPSPPEILKNAFGKDEANAVVNEVSDLIGGHFTSEVVVFRPDLSYFPAK